MTPTSPNITREVAGSTANSHSGSTLKLVSGEEAAKLAANRVTKNTLKETLVIFAGFVFAGIIVLAFLAYITAVLGLVVLS